MNLSWAVIIDKLMGFIDRKYLRLLTKGQIIY